MSIECRELHKIFNDLPRFRFPFDYKDIPLNGIYVLFEDAEFAHGADRIVRIGTHTGVNLLRSRLRQHFLTENKDSSIFRKNIGRAILNTKGSDYLNTWNLVMTTRDSKEKYGHLIDWPYQNQIEKEVSSIIQKNFSFCVFEISDKNIRLDIESRIISTVSLCNECIPSKGWFGFKSPIEKIRESGLWLVNELYKKPVNKDDIEYIKILCLKEKNFIPIQTTKKTIKEKNKKRDFGKVNKIWVNINKPTKKLTIYTDLNCPFVLDKRETHRKGIEELKIDGGWKSFPSFSEASAYCNEWEENKGYLTSVCC
jgi:hypothetical protein